MVAVAQDDWDYRFAKYGQVLVQVVWVVASAAVVVWADWVCAYHIADDAEQTDAAALDADFGGDIREYHSHAPLAHHAADDNCVAYGYNLGHNNNRH